ncbi:hypothetical protein GCM10022405_09240 [Gibbsiella dentisursi]|uniref:Uncharacterized protein n=1 Tax=Gibbsiella dentisursi TaxID=796890 RepID=A0ABP7KR98_9GAMM
MLIIVSKFLYFIALAICICNSVVGTFTIFTSDRPFDLGKLIQYYIPTMLLIVFYFFVIRKKMH